MENHTKPFLLAIIILIAFALESCKTFKPVRGKKHIVLLVNTSDISQGDAKEISSFPDQHSVSDSLYKTHVFRGDSIVWLGVSTSSVEDEVVIDRIIPRGKHNILGAAAESDGIPGVNGRAVGTIIADAKRRKKAYSISFTVNKSDGSSNSYTLDPILRVH